MSQKVMDSAKFEQKLSVALSDCNDLMATEGKCYLKYYIQYHRNIMKKQNTAESSDPAMNWSCQLLKVTFLKSMNFGLDIVSFVQRPMKKCEPLN